MVDAKELYSVRAELRKFYNAVGTQKIIEYMDMNCKKEKDLKYINTIDACNDNHIEIRLKPEAKDKSKVISNIIEFAKYNIYNFINDNEEDQNIKKFCSANPNSICEVFTLGDSITIIL